MNTEIPHGEEYRSVGYRDLTSEIVSELTPEASERTIFDMLVERATITGGGNILRWSEFNENPDPLINELLAKVLEWRMETRLGSFHMAWGNTAILSIESSASYLATALAYELQKHHQLPRPLRIVRARKMPHGEVPSPARGDNTYDVQVFPITANGGFRYLSASLPEDHDYRDITFGIVVDDFLATGSTLNGGVRLFRDMFNAEIVIPLAALGKPDQQQVHDNGLMPITAADVRFWGDEVTGSAMISMNGFRPKNMFCASIQDFRS